MELRPTRLRASRRRAAQLNGDDARPSIAAVLTAHALLRIAGSATGVLIGLALANHHAGSRASAAVAGSVGAASFAAELLASVPLGIAADALRPRLLMSAGTALGAAAARRRSSRRCLRT